MEGPEAEHEPPHSLGQLPGGSSSTPMVANVRSRYPEQQKMHAAPQALGHNMEYIIKTRDDESTAKQKG